MAFYLTLAKIKLDLRLKLVDWILEEWQERNIKRYRHTEKKIGKDTNKTLDVRKQVDESVTDLAWTKQKPHSEAGWLVVAQEWETLGITKNDSRSEAEKRRTDWKSL